MNEYHYSLLRAVLTNGREGCGLDNPAPVLDKLGWAAEFGVYSGTSLGMIAEHMPVIGFDSFEGLPEDWREGFPKGAFDLSGQPSLGSGLLPPANAMIVPGWFKDTTPWFPFPDLTLVHIDCDLYSSTLTALNSVSPYIGVGTIVVFDEYEGVGPDGEFSDEKRAWEYFLITFGYAAEQIGHHAEAAAFKITRGSDD